MRTTRDTHSYHHQPPRILQEDGEPAPAVSGTYRQSANGCGTFRPILNTLGSRIVDIGFDEAPESRYFVLPLTTPFRFMGIHEIKSLVITETGSINLDGSVLIGETANPIELNAQADNPYDLVPRISVHQMAGLKVVRSEETGVAALRSGNSIIISWEPAYLGGFGGPQVRFQAELYDNGDIDMRWDGQLGIGNNPVAVGIEDITRNVAFPAEGGPFNPVGVSTTQQAGSFCRRFEAVVDDGSPPIDPELYRRYDQDSSSCEEYTSILGVTGSDILNINTFEGTYQTGVNLERPFMLTDVDPLRLIVTSSGSINLRGSTSVSDDANPISINPNSATPYDNVPRISVCQMEGISVRRTPVAGVVFRDTGSSVIVSWEFAGILQGEFQLFFQAELFDNGDVELRWKAFGPAGDLLFVAAGIEDETVGIAYPALGLPFVEIGDGVGNEFPGGQCRRFRVETDPPVPGVPTAPTLPPIRSPVPPTPPRPTSPNPPSPTPPAPTPPSPTPPTPTPGPRRYEQDSQCSPFTSLLGMSGSEVLTVSTVDNSPSARVVLSRPFRFMGSEEITTLIATQAGSINLRGSTVVGRSADPLELNSDSLIPYEHVPRISVAQTGDATVVYSTTTGVMFRDTGSSVIFSWESMVVNGVEVKFQVELYDDGNIEMRWSGDSASLTVSAGIEDMTMGVVYPLSISGFSATGVGPYPTGLCRRFYVAGNGDVPAPTPVPPPSGIGSYQETTQCVQYASIATEPRSVLMNMGYSLSPTAKVVLNRPFKIMGMYDINELTVTETGSINLDGSLLVGDHASPISMTNDPLDPFSSVSRISVAQQGYFTVYPTDREDSGVFVLDTGYSVIVSWEPAGFAEGIIGVYFQVELFDEGDIEFRWEWLGQFGYFIEVASGVEFDGKAFPLSGVPFEADGVSPEYPGGLCRRLRVTAPVASGATAVPEPATSPQAPVGSTTETSMDERPPCIGLAMDQRAAGIKCLEAEDARVYVISDENL